MLNRSTLSFWEESVGFCSENFAQVQSTLKLLWRQPSASFLSLEFTSCSMSPRVLSWSPVTDVLSPSFIWGLQLSAFREPLLPWFFASWMERSMSWSREVFEGGCIQMQTSIRKLMISVKFQTLAPSVGRHTLQVYKVKDTDNDLIICRRRPWNPHLSWSTYSIKIPNVSM